VIRQLECAPGAGQFYFATYSSSSATTCRPGRKITVGGSKTYGRIVTIGARRSRPRNVSSPRRRNLMPDLATGRATGGNAPGAGCGRRGRGRCGAPSRSLGGLRGASSKLRSCSTCSARLRTAVPGIVVSVLGLIYATIRVLSLNLGHAFVLLGHGLEQRFYELERHLDPQTQRSAPDPAFGRFYIDASISSAFIALVYLICLLNVFSRL
jgi:hypothetical protein